MELRPCGGCRRHVAVDAATCPFCAALVTSAPQRARPKRLARAAIFAAAIAGCSDHAHAPAAKGSATAGSDDLEQLLDEQPKTADHPVPPTDAAIDAEAIAASVADAAVDAGVDPQVLAKKKKQAELRQREAERKRLEEQQRLLDQQRFDHIQAKPYGAPPARRRVV